jgi:hypothetical protein
MCCRLSVEPLDKLIAARILTIGQFQPIYFRPGEPIATNWRREIPEEGCIVEVSLGESFGVNISPAISAYAHHFGKRIAAGVYFEIAAKYAERVGGRIFQRATVIGCKPEDGSELLIAHYPDQPLLFEKVCSGFQEVFLGA